MWTDERKFTWLVNELRWMEDRFMDVLTRLTHMEKMMAVNFDRLTAAVEANTTVDGSVVELLTRLAKMIRELAPTQAAINELAAKLEASTQIEADAVVANTPADEPPVDPVPVP